jgi:hypothetical protein
MRRRRTTRTTCILRECSINYHPECPTEAPSDASRSSSQATSRRAHLSNTCRNSMNASDFATMALGALMRPDTLLEFFWTVVCNKPCDHCSWMYMYLVHLSRPNGETTFPSFATRHEQAEPIHRWLRVVLSLSQRPDWVSDPSPCEAFRSRRLSCAYVSSDLPRTPIQANTRRTICSAGPDRTLVFHISLTDSVLRRVLREGLMGLR